MGSVLDDIRAEQARQVEKWGAQRDHTWPEWLAIFTEELGEAVKVLNEDAPEFWLPPRPPHPPRSMPSIVAWRQARPELVQAAAVLCTWIEGMDYWQGTPPGPIEPP